MNTELAKQLKDAGFRNHKDCGKCEYGITVDSHLPQLSELIEACGDKFERLIRTDEGEFIAYTYPEYELNGHVRIDKWQQAKTPEEAVAKLWLELNKKQ